MRTRVMLALVVCNLLGTVQLASAQDAYYTLREMFQCLHVPAPTGALLQLQSSGNLGERWPAGPDDESCWTLQPPLFWSGAQFVTLCAVLADAQVITANPQLYWDNGTYAPFAEVWLMSEMDEGYLDIWARATLPAESHFSIDPAYEAGRNNALSCSEWDFPLQSSQ